MSLLLSIILILNVIFLLQCRFFKFVKLFFLFLYFVVQQASWTNMWMFNLLFYITFVYFQIAQSSEMMQPLLSSALRVLLHGLGLNQSTFVLQHLFSTQRSLVTKVSQTAMYKVWSCTNIIHNMNAGISITVHLIERKGNLIVLN